MERIITICYLWGDSGTIDLSSSTEQEYWAWLHDILSLLELDWNLCWSHILDPLPPNLMYVAHRALGKSLPAFPLYCRIVLIDTGILWLWHASKVVFAYYGYGNQIACKGSFKISNVIQ